MSSEVIAITHVQSSGPTFRGDLYELLVHLDAVEFSPTKPYFVFDITVPAENTAAVATTLRQHLPADEAEDLITFLESMDWEASFLYLG